MADVVEALIGAFLSTCGEAAALLFIKWLGVEVEFSCRAYQRNFPVQPHVHVNVRRLESLLNYSFRDASLLVEALTHGSYMLPEIPRCYQVCFIMLVLLQVSFSFRVSILDGSCLLLPYFPLYR